MFNQGMNQGLPFSPTQLQAQIGNYQFVPNIALNQNLIQFQELVPVISQLLINEIQKNAQMSPTRIFLFNQMVFNNFANDSFVGLVKSTIEYFAFIYRSGRISNLQHGIQIAVTDMVSFISAQNVRNFPALLSYVDQNAVNTVLNKFDMVCNEIRYGQNNNMQVGQIGNNAFIPQSMQSINSYGSGVIQNNAGIINNGNSSGLFMNGQSGVPNQTSQDNLTGRSYMTNSITTPIQDAIVDYSLKNEQESFSTEHLKTAEKRWKPTPEKPYRPAYTFSSQNLFVKALGENFLYQVREREESMDEAKHRITPLFGDVVQHSLIPNKTQETMEDLKEAIADAKDSIPNKDVTVGSYARVVLEDMPIELCVETVWIGGVAECYKRRSSEPDQKQISILQWDQKLVYAVEMDEPSTIDILQKLPTTATELIECLKTNSDKFGEVLSSQINTRLTKTVNRYIRNYLSIPSLRINSFITDWFDLINHIGNKFGEVIAANMLAKEEEIIKHSVTFVNTETAVNITKSIYDIEKNPFQYFVEKYSFTYLRYFSHRLDIDFVNNTSALLTKSNSKQFYDLAEIIFKEYGNKADRHLIRTIDDHILEVTQGWVPNSYLISLVK